MSPPFLESRLLQAPHGFFGREGGVSRGIFASLNCGYGSGDDKLPVAENRARAASRFGHKNLLTLYQVHSARVVTVDAPLAPQEADAWVTKTPGLPLGILTADCAPVLFEDSEARVIGAAHAGWKGAFSGVIEATLSAMEALGADRARLAAAVGPCIGVESYEVGPEFIARINDARFFSGNHFNLKAYVRHLLTEAGVKTVEALPHDTCADETRFFSYRRATLRKEPGYGRQVSVIMLR